MCAMSPIRHRLRVLSPLAVVFALSACGDDDALPTDAGVPDAGATDAGPPLSPWPRALPATDSLGTVRGLRVMRAIIHAHSPLSHDACDGEGFAGGMLLDAPCLDHMREAVCTLRLDALNLTDHAEHLYEVTHEAKFWKRPGDVEERNEAGELAAVRWDCGDGTDVLVTVGTENALMPVGLVRHPVDSTDQDVLAAAYRANGPDAVARFREAGGLVFVAHTEGRELAELRTLGMDGIEIYNIHANVDPDIRVEFLGLGAADYLMNVLAFTSPTSRLAPDLAFLGFFEENQNDLDKWDTLLAEGLQITGINGCDAHENTFPQLMRDGERVDSYRRMMRWATMHLRVPETTLAAQREALDAGRGYVAFEVFGTPVGFDVHAEDASGATHEMGEFAPPGTTLRVTRPSLSPDVPDAALALVSMRILKAAPGGGVEVAQGNGESLTYVATEPGAYRAEVRIVPEHTRPYLGRLADTLIREHAWVYANPIYVGAPPR
jgi:hypothetical protein